MGERVRGEGIKKYKHIVTEEPRGVEYSIGNGVAKELICMTHGLEQWCGECLRE